MPPWCQQWVCFILTEDCICQSGPGITRSLWKRVLSKSFLQAYDGCTYGEKNKSQPHQFSHHSVSSVVTVHRVTAVVFGTNPSATKTCYSLEGPNLHFPAICELVCVQYIWWSEQSKNQCGMYGCMLDGGKTFFFDLVFITEVWSNLPLPEAMVSKAGRRWGLCYSTECISFMLYSLSENLKL